MNRNRMNKLEELPDEQMRDMLGHEVVYAPLHQLLVDLGVVEHLGLACKI